jgi:hypothetical protein
VELLAGLLAALLPEPMRERLVRRHGVDAPGWSCLVGTVELFGGALWLVDDFLVRIRGIVDQHADVVVAAAERGALGDEHGVGIAWMGSLSWLTWLLHPLTLLVMLLTGTGAVRLLAFTLTREAVAEPLVWLLWRLWNGLAVAPARAAAEAQRFGPPRPDRVLARPDGALLVLTARPRPEWNELVAIQVGERFYRLAEVGERVEEGRRWRCHRLEELPESSVLRGLLLYEPPGAGATAATPSPPGPAVP